MARSLAKLHAQIAKLQKEADAIQSNVIARIKREIAQYGLTAQHLFGTTDDGLGKAASKAAPQAPKAASAKRSGAAKAAKYSDDQGNTWHGIGKRPAWVHAALEGGRSLGDFLVGVQKEAPAAKAAPKASRKVAAKKKAAPARRVKAAADEPAVGVSAQRSAKATAATPAAKPAKAARSAKAAQKQPASKKTRVAKVATKRAKPSAVATAAADQTASA